MQSSLGRKPCKVQTPLDKAAMLATRWEMLLSPGTVISVSIRDARFIRNSIEALINFADSPSQQQCDVREGQHPILDTVVQLCYIAAARTCASHRTAKAASTTEPGRSSYNPCTDPSLRYRAAFR